MIIRQSVPETNGDSSGFTSLSLILVKIDRLPAINLSFFHSVKLYGKGVYKTSAAVFAMILCTAVVGCNPSQNK